MTYLNKIVLLIGLVAFCSLVPGTFSSPYTLSDQRVQNLDVTPALGRGYSIMTNSFTSSCLEVSETTVPSYNYKFEYYDFIDDGKYVTIETLNTTTDEITTVQVDTKTREIKQRLETYYSHRWVQSIYYHWRYGYLRRYEYRRTRHTRTVDYTVTQRSNNLSTNRNVTTVDAIPVGEILDKNRHMIVAVMRIERFYSSIRDESSSISDAAIDLLDAEDYIGFFKACGPNYVRGIRRAQEVTAVFTFQSDTVTKAKDYLRLLQEGIQANATEVDRTTENKSLTIQIQGYGLGSGVKGSGGSGLVATNLKEYYEAMKFAFRAMTQTSENYGIGQVHGIEVVPWVDNVKFQTSARLRETVIDVPLPRSLIPPAVSVDEDVDIFVNDAATRLSFRCKDPAFQIDKYGNCCEENDLFDYTSREYVNNQPMTKVCRPVRTLGKPFVKNNLMANGEFVARLDSAVRYKLNELSVMQQCISAASAYPDSQNYNLLKSTNAMVESEYENDRGFSILELKLILDPFNDYGVVKHMTKELDEFMTMFYSPCLAALFGTNAGSNPNTDPTYFMAYPWHSHDECLHMSCLARGMRWDRNEGGCIPGLLTGATASPYPINAHENTKCQMNGNLGGDNEECKHELLGLVETHQRATTCWQKVIPSGQVSFFLDNYCMPQISADQISPIQQLALSVNRAEGCEQTFHTAAVSKKLLFRLKRTKFFVAVMTNDCPVTGGYAIMSPSAGSISAPDPSHTFQYHFSQKTITVENCDKVLTLDSCNEVGRLTMEDADSSLMQQWIFKNDGLIESVDCADLGSYYIATKATGEYESGKMFSTLGVTTDSTNWEAEFEVIFPEDEVDDD